MRRSVGLAVIGAVAIALSARLGLTLPGTSVPQTAQTLAVVMVGGVLGPAYGAVSVALYLGLGVVGVPVFAGGASGLETLVGPTGGYLLGFVCAAAVAGWWMGSGWCLRGASAVAGMALAHLQILMLGWAWLALELGSNAAYRGGVQPFLVGAVVKSVIAGVTLAWVARSRERTAQAQPD